MATVITASLVKELRERTGVGMAKCKEALEEANGDIEAAIVVLRKAGMASAVKKESRDTNEGVIASALAGSAIVLVQVNAETDFVVKNENFQAFARDLATVAAKSSHADVEALLNEKMGAQTVEERRVNLVQSLGENIKIKRMLRFEKTPGVSRGLYTHMQGKIVAVVSIEGSEKEEALAKDIAMHVAAESPEYLDVSDVPQDIVAREKDIAASQIKNKPANILEKILEGKMGSFYDRACLVRQTFIKNPELTIQKVVDARSKESGAKLKVKEFIRWTAGGA